MMLAIVIITYLLNIADLFFTLRLAKNYGDGIEGNPIGRLMLKDKRVAIIVKLLMIIPLAVLYFINIPLLIWIVFGVYVLLTLYHVFIVIYLKVHGI